LNDPAADVSLSFDLHICLMGYNILHALSALYAQNESQYLLDRKLDGPQAVLYLPKREILKIIPKSIHGCTVLKSVNSPTELSQLAIYALCTWTDGWMDG
jgi:hypothetical protein